MDSNLETLQSDFEKMNEKRRDILKELKELEQDETVKRYLELSMDNKDLYSTLKELALQIRTETMRTCSHIWITTSCDDYSGDEHFCVKCGLDTKAVEMNRENNWSYQFLNPERSRIIQNMAEMLERKYYDQFTGIKTDIICDSDLAQSIYRGVIAVHPNITDEQAVYYLKAALHNIRTKEVTENVKIKRKKRLRLSNNFYKWNEDEVIKQY